MEFKTEYERETWETYQRFLEKLFESRKGGTGDLTQVAAMLTQAALNAQSNEMIWGAIDFATNPEPVGEQGEDEPELCNECAAAPRCDCCGQPVVGENAHPDEGSCQDCNTGHCPRGDECKWYHVGAGS